MADVSVRAGLLGDEYNAAAEQSKILERAIIELNRMGLSQQNVELQDLIVRYRQAAQAAKQFELSRHQQNDAGLDDEFRAITTRASLLGRSYNAAADRASALQNAIIDLTRRGVDRNDAAMHNLIARYQAASREARSYEQATHMVTSAQQRMAATAKMAAAAVSAAAIAGSTQGIRAYAAREQREIAFAGLLRAIVGSLELWTSCDAWRMATPFEFEPLLL